MNAPLRPLAVILAETILGNAAFERVRLFAARVLASGLNAGDRYPEIWIRDLATFLEPACDMGGAPSIQQALRMFFDFQQADGAVIDGFTPREASVDPYKYIHCARHPDLVGHKNTVETDQESSLVQAVRRYVEKTGDLALLSEFVDGATVLDRLEAALVWVYARRWSEFHGLAWNATTIDWGDVQPEHPWGVELNADSHPALCIYTNAMLAMALRDFLWLRGKAGLPEGPWARRLAELKRAVHTWLWDTGRKKFIPHVYLERGSPFPPDYDETPIFFHGGTAMAMLAGLLSREDALACHERMLLNVKEAGARTVGLTLWPLYKVPSMPNSNYHVPFVYQNGGDWPWWGGRVPQGLLACGLAAEAYETLVPIVRLVEEHQGFYEWHGPDGAPHGSRTFRGAAGVVSSAIHQLQTWARAQLPPPSSK